MTIWRARWTSGVVVSTFMFAATARLHDGMSRGAPSTFTRQIRQLAAIDRQGW